MIHHQPSGSTADSRSCGNAQPPPSCGGVSVLGRVGADPVAELGRERSGDRPDRAPADGLDIMCPLRNFSTLLIEMSMQSI